MPLTLRHTLGRQIGQKWFQMKIFPTMVSLIKDESRKDNSFCVIIACTPESPILNSRVFNSAYTAITTTTKSRVTKYPWKNKSGTNGKGAGNSLYQHFPFSNVYLPSTQAWTETPQTEIKFCQDHRECQWFDQRASRETP